MNDYDEKIERVNKALVGHLWPTLRPFLSPCSSIIEKPDFHASKLPHKPFDFPKAPEPEKTEWSKAVDSLQNQKTKPVNQAGYLKPKR